MSNSPDSDKKSADTGTDRMRSFAQYSGLGFQMLATIGLCAWAGVKLDAHFQNKNPWYTIGLMLLGVLGAMYQVICSITRKS
jgi:ATP synthase protein I